MSWVLDSFGYPVPDDRRKTSSDPFDDLPTYTQALTQRRQADLYAGRHPATKIGLLDPPDTEGLPAGGGVDRWGYRCKDCRHLTKNRHNSRNYYKCGLLPITSGPATDIRVSWPACTRFGLD